MTANDPGQTDPAVPESDPRASDAPFWQRDRYRTLFALLLLLSVLHPVLERRIAARPLFDLFLLLLLAGAIRAARKNSRRFWVSVAIASPAALVLMASELSAYPLVDIVAYLLFGVFLAFQAVSIVGDLLHCRRVTTDMLFGACCGYWLIAVFWSFLYMTIYLTDPASFGFSEAVGVPREDHLFGVFVYFSFVTMTTLGYGDIVPISSAARTGAWLEAVIGQLFIALLVARLVGMHLATQQDEAGASDPDETQAEG